MNTRRKFLKGFGIVSAFGAMSVAAKQSLSNEIKEDIQHLEPTSGSSLTMVADNRTAKEKHREYVKKYGDTRPLFIQSNSVVTNQVSMAVGKDNRLWLKVNDEWKRVAVDN